MADKFEQFVNAFLRLNGYFTVPNFIVHAGDDPSRISRGMVGNLTETDTIGVRMPYSREQAGALQIANFPLLVDGAGGRFDVVFAEAKSGASKPNGVWAHGNEQAIAYLVRFVGRHNEADVQKIAKALAAQYQHSSGDSRYRYVVFAQEPNAHYAGKGVTYITFREAIGFLVEVRGQCWIEANIGVASVHPQWDDLLKRIFEIANDTRLGQPERVTEIERLLGS